MHLLPKYHRGWVQLGNGTGTHARLLNLVGFNKKVLEIGCSSGYLSRVMQDRGCEVTGVEADIGAAELARRFCSRVIVGDVETLDWETVLADERFEVITFGDVLEHLHAPEMVLKKLRTYLGAQGYIVVSLPNIAHGSIRLSLLLGHFEYMPLGILDETHLRFYTKDTARQLLEAGGFSIETVLSVNQQTPKELVDEVLATYPQRDPSWLQTMLKEPEAQAFQYVFQAYPEKKSRVAAQKKQIGDGSKQTGLSIIVFQQNREINPFQRIRGLAAGDFPFRDAVFVSQWEPRPHDVLPSGWRWQARLPNETLSQALNKAVASVSSEVILIMGAHLALEGAALAALSTCMAINPAVGVAGGRVLTPDGGTILRAGAYLAPPIGKVTYRGAHYPTDDSQWGNWEEVDFIPVECICFRRSLWQALNGFDESYLAYYFDADFCVRVRQAGRRVVVEPGVAARSVSPEILKLETLFDLQRDRLNFVYLHYGQRNWPEDFLDIESAFLNEVESGIQLQALRLAYLWRMALGKDNNLPEKELFSQLYQRSRLVPSANLDVIHSSIRPHHFSSQIPIIGWLIAGFRARWGDIAARWYVESLIRQQNLFNQAMTDRLATLQEQLSGMEQVVARLSEETTDLRKEQNTRSAR